MSHPLRPRFEEALDDVLVLVKEFLLVLWRFNPAGVAFHTCHQMFTALNDSTPPAERARIVAEGIAAIEIVPVETFEADVGKGIGDITAGITAETIAGATKEYPEVEGFLRESLGNEDAALAAAFSRMTLNAVAKHRATYEQLHAHYNQLVESLPRYTAIMNRSGLLEGVLAFAAGFFGGPVAGWGADAWNNWRTSNDQEFCQKFGAAFDQFVEACRAYTVAGEETLSIVYDRLMDEFRTLHRRLFDCYEQLAAEGWDIEPLYRRYTTADEPLPDDGRHLFEIALSNLEENPAVHFRRIENMRRMIGLDRSPAPPDEAIPAAVETAIPPLVVPPLPVRATVATSPAAPISVVPTPADPPPSASPPPLPAAASGCLDADALRAAFAGFACDKVYVAPDIPADKVQRAIGRYAPHLKPADVLLFCDTTLFGTATEGIMLTATSLHWRNPWEDAGCVAFADIATVTNQAKSGMFTQATVHVNGKDIHVWLGEMAHDNDMMRRLAKILRMVAPPGIATPAPSQAAMQIGDAIHGQCSACGKGYVAAASNRGTLTACDRCGAEVVIGR